MSYVKGVLAIPGMTSKILVAVETSYAEPVHTRQGVEVLAKVKADAAALLQDLKRHFAFCFASFISGSCGSKKMGSEIILPQKQVEALRSYYVLASRARW